MWRKIPNRIIKTKAKNNPCIPNTIDSIISNKIIENLIGCALISVKLTLGKVSYLTLLVISKESITIKGIMTLSNKLWLNWKNPKKNVTKVRAQNGIGRPVKNFLSNPTNWTLKRANLKAPVITGKELIKIPIEFNLYKYAEYNKNAGANPKDTTSDKESNSTPISLLDLVNLAISPSSASKTAATIISQPAFSKLPLLDWIIDKNPQNKFSEVNKLGIIDGVILILYIIIN